jgi:hypothetical protein
MKYPPLLDDHYQFEFNFFYARLEEKNALLKWSDESFLRIFLFDISLPFWGEAIFPLTKQQWDRRFLNWRENKAMKLSSKYKKKKAGGGKFFYYGHMVMLHVTAVMISFLTT